MVAASPPMLTVVLLGRRLRRAQLGVTHGDEWIKALDNPTRIEGLKIPEVVARLRLKPGDAVADIGAGTGLFSMPLARAVAPAGRCSRWKSIKGSSMHIVQKAREQQVSNVQPVLGTFDDPDLPPASWISPSSTTSCTTSRTRAEYLKALARTAETDRTHRGDRLPSRRAAATAISRSCRSPRSRRTTWMADAGWNRFRRSSTVRGQVVRDLRAEQPC